MSESGAIIDEGFISTDGPWHQLYTDLGKRHGHNPAKSAVARKILIAAWHVLSRTEPFKPATRTTGPTDPASASSAVVVAA